MGHQPLFASKRGFAIRKSPDRAPHSRLGRFSTCTSPLFGLCGPASLTGQTSALSLPDLKKPLRPFFIHPATSTPPHIPDDPPFIPIICLSASRWVGSGSMDEIPSVTRLPKRTMGFEYVQGAGDDDELWGRVSRFARSAKAR